MTNLIPGELYCLKITRYIAMQYANSGWFVYQNENGALLYLGEREIEITDEGFQYDQPALQFLFGDKVVWLVGGCEPYLMRCENT